MSGAVRAIRYGSVCSGIEAVSVGWRGLPFAPKWFAENASFPSAVLKHRFANVPNLGDFTRIDETAPAIDLLVGGTPCQDFSIAGLRAGLAGERGNLTLEFVRLAERLRPRWLLWENVPGVLSVDGGGAFGAFLGEVGKLGYGFAYRVLDAQYAGVPQRRRRVFAVGYLGDWRRAAAVLFESASLRWNPPPSREAGAGVAGSSGAVSSGRGWRAGADEAAGGHVVAALTRHGVGASGADDNQGQAGHLLAFGGNNTNGPIEVATACNAHGGPHGRLDFESETFIAHSLRGNGFDASEDGPGRGTPIVIQERAQSTGSGGPNGKGYRTDGQAFTLEARSQVQAVAFMPARTFGADGGIDERFAERDVSDALHTGSVNGNKAPVLAFDWQSGGDVRHSVSAEHTSALSRSQTPAVSAHGVRRLTPREAERLQGFDDNWTLIPTKAQKKLEPEMIAYYRDVFPDASEADLCHLAKDGPRYEAIGNSMATPVLHWLGKRIALVDGL